VIGKFFMCLARKVGVLLPDVFAFLVEGFFLIDEFLELGEEPGVDFGEVEDFVGGEAGAEGVADVEDALGVGGDEFLLDEVAGSERRPRGIFDGINGIYGMGGGRGTG